MNERMHQSIVAELDRQAADLERRCADRLHEQRARLCSEPVSRARPAILPWAAVAASVVIAMTWWGFDRFDHPSIEASAPAMEASIDLELLQSEDFEVAENLEFYLWLDGQLADGDAG